MMVMLVIRGAKVDSPVSMRMSQADCTAGEHLRTLKRFLTFSSDAPTYLLRISGPLTILGSLPFSILPICRAIRVFPAHHHLCSLNRCLVSRHVDSSQPVIVSQLCARPELGLLTYKGPFACRDGVSSWQSCAWPCFERL